MPIPNVNRNTLAIETPLPPPNWALLERELIRAQTLACEAFFDRYFDERGYLICIPRWGGNDGPDDAIENLTGWPILHALGASDSILEMYKLAWEGHLLQYTEAKTVEVPIAREGCIIRNSPSCLIGFITAKGWQSLTCRDSRILTIAPFRTG